MKMIYVASMSMAPDRDSQWVRSFKNLGVEVLLFSTWEGWDMKLDLYSRIERRFNIGHHAKQVRKKLLETVASVKPDWVHFRLPLEFDGVTINAIKKQGVFVTEYFNDDPFSHQSVWGLHWVFKKALKYYDAHFVYRQKNVADFLSCGAKQVLHCPPTYVSWRHNFENSQDPSIKDDIDAAFIGHWENDCRTDCIDALVSNGYKVRLHGSGWTGAIKNRPSEILGEIHPIFGDAYNTIYRKAKVGLCFFSKINKDNWTERALEIIAVGGLLVCERTSEAEQYFEDRKEAFFFSNVDELLEIMKLITQDTILTSKVRAAGHERLLKGRNSVNDRAVMIVSLIKKNILI